MGINHFNDPKAFIDYLNDMHDYLNDMMFIKILMIIILIKKIRYS